MKSILFPGANPTAQWFADDFPGVVFDEVEKVCLHTTETDRFPGYKGGSQAPNLTVFPIMSKKKLEWRQHFPLNMSSRALENKSGGVLTNTLRTVQVELIGTCDSNGPGMYWPSAPDWALEGLADFAAFMSLEWEVLLLAASMWLNYGKDVRRPGITPASYGNSPARMSFDEWNKFRGYCGHQHVPENHHGDPGNIEIQRVLGMAARKLRINSVQEDDEVDAAQEDRIASKVWNRFLVPDTGEESKSFRDALTEMLDNSQDVLKIVKAQQEQIDRLAEMVEKLRP